MSSKTGYIFLRRLVEHLLTKVVFLAIRSNNQSKFSLQGITANKLLMIRVRACQDLLNLGVDQVLNVDGHQKTSIVFIDSIQFFL